MNIGMLLIIIFECVAGVASTLYIVVSMFAVLGYKIFRKIKYHMPLYD